MDLRLAEREGRNCTVVVVGGQIDMDTAPELHDFLQQVVDRGARQVVLDFTDVSFLDSSGLGVLVVWFKELHGRGGRLSVAAVRQLVAYVLRVSAVDEVLGVYDSVGAAEADVPPMVS